MPGICGILDASRSLDLTAKLEQMLRPMQHHAWYQSEQLVLADAGLALGRVSLGFVNCAPQPVTVGALTCVMDGELYDVGSLASRLGIPMTDLNRDAHARMLVHGYQLQGDDFLRNLHGSFAAAIWHDERKALILVNDRFGTRPVYYASLAGRFIFGSSLKTVMADDAVSHEPSHTGLAQFFTFGHYLRDDTSLEAVRVLPAAACVTITADGMKCQIERYVNSAIAASGNPLDKGEWLEQIDHAFVEAVGRQVDGTENLGLSLSGGLDARSILAVIDHDQIAIRTVCLGMPGSLDHRSSERLAALVGCDHRNHVLGEGFLSGFREHLEEMVRLTDGQYLSQCIVMPTLPLYRNLGIEVLLRGHAGELMHMHKAYNYSLDSAALAIKTGGELEEWLFRRLQAYMLDGVVRPLFRGDLQNSLTDLARESLRKDLADVESIDPPLKRIWALFVQQRLRRETVLSLLKFRSVVEPRLPFLDNELVELLLAAPTELKVGEELQTFILRKHRPSFLSIANANTGAPVGASHTAQRVASMKMKVLAKLGVPGYQPYERLGLWLRRELAPTVREILLDERCLENGVYDADGVRHVVSQHLEHGRNHTFLLMAMMIYELGRRQLENVQVGQEHDLGEPLVSAPGQ